MPGNRKQIKAFFNKYWPVFAGFFIIQILFDQVRTSSFYITGTRGYINWPSSILNSVADYTLWALLLGLLYRTYIYISPIFGKKSWLMLIGVAFIAGFAQAFVQQFLSLTIMDLFGRFDKPYTEVLSDSLILFLPSVFQGVLVVFLLFTLIAALDYYDRFRDQQLHAAQLESELSKSRLEVLQAQLNPHFLFNALNTVSMMVRNQKGVKAISMISSLSDLLRTSLQMNASQFISLKEELKVVGQYLKIEQQRFNDRLRVEFTIPKETESCGVPNMILQPILENAFKYGVSENLEEAVIKIESRIVVDRLVIKVMNNGSPLPDNWVMEEGMGVGLTNVLKRLSHLFDQYQFDLFNQKEIEMVVAKIEIPVNRMRNNG